MEYEQELDKVLAEIRTILVQKHHDYGPSNLVRRGNIGMIIRTEDKLARIEHLDGKVPLVENEPLEQSWQDVAGYGIQAILYIRGVIR